VGPLNPGTYAYQASYSGDANYVGSVSGCVSFTVHNCPLSNLTANLDITTQPEFAIHSTFWPSPNCSLSFVTQQVAIAVGSYSITLPPGSFALQKNGSYVYKGTVSGASLNIKVTPSNGGYVLEESGTKVSPAQSNPVPVTITIGNTTGTISVNAKFGN
jgi:hypothetical protein